MKKFLSSKIFVIVSTLITLVIGGIAGWLLGYQPNVSGNVKGSVSGTQYGSWGTTSGSTTTEYLFQIKTACGYWLIALIITFLVLLICILIRKLYIKNSATESDKT